MQVLIHKDFDVLEKILPKWERLTEASHEITVFQDMSWLKSWWEHKDCKQAISPYIVEVIKGNETIGIMPLYCSMRSFASLKFRVLKPIGSIQSDYLIPILSKEHSPKELINKAIGKIYDDKQNWDFIDWSDIPEDSIFDKHLTNALAKEAILSKRKRTFICPYLTLDKDFANVKIKYDQKLVREILRKIRRLNRDGELGYHYVTEIDQIERVLTSFFDFHCERWENTDTPSRYEQEEEREYSLKTAKSLFNSNLLHLSYLTYNDDIAAVEFAMADEQKIYLYLTAFNMKYRKHSVGNILLYKLIANACEQGYKIVDFARGEESYKEQWGTVETFNVQYHFFNKSLRSSLFRLINNTYYSKQFEQRNVISRFAIKTLIRGTAVLLSIYDRFMMKGRTKRVNF